MCVCVCVCVHSRREHMLLHVCVYMPVYLGVMACTVYVHLDIYALLLVQGTETRVNSCILVQWTSDTRYPQILNTSLQQTLFLHQIITLLNLQEKDNFPTRIKLLVNYHLEVPLKSYGDICSSCSVIISMKK